MTALELYHRGVARGLSFHLVAPGMVGIDGPHSVIEEMDADIEAQAANLVAVVQEFAGDTFPVWSATEIIRQHTYARRAGGRRHANRQ